jgi:hypothetical protein
MENGKWEFGKWEMGNGKLKIIKKGKRKWEIKK